MATRTFGGTIQIWVLALSDTKVTASNVKWFSVVSWSGLLKSTCSDAVVHHVCEWRSYQVDWACWRATAESAAWNYPETRMHCWLGKRRYFIIFIWWEERRRQVYFVFDLFLGFKIIALQHCQVSRMSLLLLLPQCPLHQRRRRQPLLQFPLWLIDEWCYISYDRLAKTPVVPWAVCPRDGADRSSVLSGLCSSWWHADNALEGTDSKSYRILDLSKKLKSLVWTITSSSEQGASQRCGRVPLTSWGWQWMSWRRRTSQLLSSGLQSVCLALQEGHHLHPANTSLHSCMLSRRWPSSVAPCL